MRDVEHPIPTLVIIIGPQAVGKMPVGQEPACLTSYRLFHLHQVIDLVTEYFEYDSPGYMRLVQSFRAQIFEEAAKSGLDLITTGSWQFDNPAHTDIFWGFAQPYKAQGHRVCIVELLAPAEVCLERNRTENRRRHKKTDWATDDYMERFLRRHCWDSGGALPFELPLLRLETEHLTAEATAERIRAHFSFPLRSVAQ